MFTGIIEDLGTVEGVETQEDGIRLTVTSPLVTSDAHLGDSIAVNGCCLTVAEKDAERFTADVMSMTLSKTVVGDLVVGDRVNLERSCTPTTRLGGHIVQGHVDCTATIRSRAASEHWELVEIELPEQWQRYVVLDGAIAVDGISLTVAEMGADSFIVSLIPETLARTTLGTKQAGSRVNLEVDIIAKHVERLLSK